MTVTPDLLASSRGLPGRVVAVGGLPVLSADDGLELEWVAARLLTEGLFLPCDQTMTTFCPERLASPDFASGIVTHLSGSSPPPVSGRYLSLPETVSPDLHRARALELSLGCQSMDGCLSHGLPATELARLAERPSVDELFARIARRRGGRVGLRQAADDLADERSRR